MSQEMGNQRTVREMLRDPNTGNDLVGADGEMIDAETDELLNGNMYMISFRRPGA